MDATDFPPLFIRIAAFLFGAANGSFMNVCIYRWPRDGSVMAPLSQCPACGKPIPLYRNIPILTWVLQRGRAACCGVRISSRYLVVELLGAFLCLAVAEVFFVGAPAGQSITDAGIVTVVMSFFACALLVATYVDFEWMEIPDEVSLPGTAVGLVTAWLRPGTDLVDITIGAGAGFLIVQVLFVVGYERLTGRRGMGEGDAKLLMMVGAFIGWQGVLFALFGGALQGLVFVAVMLALGKSITPTRPDALDDDGDQDGASTEEADASPSEATPTEEPTGLGAIKVPYGPFLALGALEFLFFGSWIVDRYLWIVERWLDMIS